MREHNKRWLISKMKTAGSKRDHIENGSFADERNTKKYFDLENQPQHEGIKKTFQFYNNKINTGLLIRFLRGQAGNNWDIVHAEIINRIPAKLLDYKEIALWYVVDKVELKDGKLWNKRSQKYFYTGGEYKHRQYSEIALSEKITEFYIDPGTNKLIHIPQKSFKRIIKIKD